MEKLSKQQKQIAVVVAGVVALYLLYRWYTSGQTASSAATQTGTGVDPTSSDYAALAGQEQADVAGLQSQNAQLSGQEQSDVAALQGQEGADVAAINQNISGFSNAVDALTGSVQGLAGLQTSLGHQVAAIASGQQAINRHLTATIRTHRGGAFYDYYKKVTGRAPPARVRTTNFIYQAWKNGIKASALRPHPTHPHPSSNNHHVQHPNGNHAQQHHQSPHNDHHPHRPQAGHPHASGTQHTTHPHRH